MPPTPSKPPTLRDIARASGASLSTVSAALGNKPGVGKARAKEINKLAKKMGWKPNPLVSAWLSHKRTVHPVDRHLSLAYIYSATGGYHAYFSSPVYLAYLEGARTRARELGYKLDLFHYEEFGGTRLSQILRTRGIPGIIVGPLQERGSLDIQWQNFACATMAYSLALQHIHRAGNHHLRTVTMAIEKLYALGYRRIGMAISRGLDDRSSLMFSGGYWAASHRFFKKPLPIFLSDDGAPVVPKFRRWLQRSKPDALLGFQWFDQWAEETGRKIGQDLAYAHLDWRPEFQGLAGVDQQSEQIGAAAVDLVTAQIARNERGIPQRPKLSLIESQWVDGPSAPRRPA